MDAEAGAAAGAEEGALKCAEASPRKTFNGAWRRLATMTDTVDFGFEKVPPAEKTARVSGVFDAVAHRYDAMNDILSLSMHRLFKRAAVEMARLRPGQRVLDLAGGTGDIARLAAPLVGSRGAVALADLNAPMLAAGRNRLLDGGCANISFTQASAERLPFADGAFHAVLVAFGLRNFTDKAAALAEMRRVLRPGGTAVVLEFSTVRNPLLACAFEAYKATWPAIGALVAGSSAPYRYLVESIARHPDQDALQDIMRAAGFDAVEVHNLAAGAAAIHRGFT